MGTTGYVGRRKSHHGSWAGEDVQAESKDSWRQPGTVNLNSQHFHYTRTSSSLRPELLVKYFQNFTLVFAETQNLTEEYVIILY